MLKKFVLLCALGAAGLGITGCASFNPTNPNSPPVPVVIDPAIITQIQTGVATACKFVPTAQTIADIVATFWGASAAVDVVASAVKGICSAVTAVGVRRGAPHAPKYRGVVIRGSRV